MSEYKASSSELETIMKHYLERCRGMHQRANGLNAVPELEVRFGTNSKVAKPISVIDYHNVVRQLLATGWKSEDRDGMQMLRITCERIGLRDKAPPKKETPKEEAGLDPNANDEAHAEPNPAEMEGGAATNKRRLVMSSIRAEINGPTYIQEYCQYNDIERFKRKSADVKFTEKRKVQPFNMVDFEDFNFRVAYMEEENYSLSSTRPAVTRTIYDWTQTRKNFRCINRVRFSHPDYPIFVDISIVKTNKKSVHANGRTGPPLPVETIQASEVFNMPPVYEVELEMDNDRVKRDYPVTRLQHLMAQLRQCIRVVLSGLQETPYPIPYSEQQAVIEDYMSRIHGEVWRKEQKPRPYFIGPQSVSLQQEHLFQHDTTTSTQLSILEGYTVTEKADGIRALLYISKTGRVYMISNNLKVMFTGSITKEKSCWDSLLDGEFIMYGKPPNEERLFLFAAFDIYYYGMGKESHVRALPFCTNEETYPIENYRLSLMQRFHGSCTLESVTPNAACAFRFKCKHFEMYQPEHKSIFQASHDVMESKFEYEVDGLIFTPMHTGVGSTKPNEAFELNGSKYTWDACFKWKPPHYNTIDFLVQTQKDKDGKDLIRYVAHDGDKMMTRMIPYKTLILHVGFDKKRHKHMNPFHDVLHDSDEYYRNLVGTDNEQSYEAMPFVPTTPYDPDAFLCHVPLEENFRSSHSYQMKTMEREVFVEDMIVEFQYAKNDTTKQGPWKWVPLRVRQDKTQALREGKKSMNNYTTADTNWHSIHFPVTEKMITGMDDVPQIEVTDKIYYNLSEKNESTTKALRDFHNTYVKRKLIVGVANYMRNTLKITDPLLIDYAVGQGGDLPKWDSGKIRFVLGIDLHSESITNPYSGACKRYLTWRFKNRNHPMRALFLEGNGALNIRTDGKAFPTALEKGLVQSIFGQGKSTSHKKYVFQHGIAQEGFHISSCQFALHYFFENTKTLHNFLRNVAECTRLHGYFIGTCFDGQQVFDLLRTRKDNTPIYQGESIRMDKNGRKMFEITKKYSSNLKALPADETGVGLAISVYQESINKQFVEYLVHFDYLVQLMENYGFVLADKEEIKGMGLSKASSLFDQMYGTMKYEIKKEPDSSKEYGKAKEMSSMEQMVSFLNRYFVFKKVRELSKPTMDQMRNTMEDETAEAETEAIEEENIKEPEPNQEVAVPVKKARRKIKREKVQLNADNYSPISDVLFEDEPELQAVYETFSDKRKEKIMKLSERDRIMFVKELMKKQKA